MYIVKIILFYFFTIFYPNKKLKMKHNSDYKGDSAERVSWMMKGPTTFLS